MCLGLNILKPGQESFQSRASLYKQILSSRCWRPALRRPSQPCVSFFSLTEEVLRISTWFSWIMTPSSTGQTCSFSWERSSSIPRAAPSSWSRGTNKLQVSEKLWSMSERGPSGSASSPTFTSWLRSSISAEVQRWIYRRLHRKRFWSTQKKILVNQC